MVKNIVIALVAAALTLVGLSSDLSKDVALAVYCKVKPQDCSN